MKHTEAHATRWLAAVKVELDRASVARSLGQQPETDVLRAIVAEGRDLIPHVSVATLEAICSAVVRASALEGSIP